MGSAEVFQSGWGVLQLLEGAEEACDLLLVEAAVAQVDFKIARQLYGGRAGHHELQGRLGLLQEVNGEAVVFGFTDVGTQPLEDYVKA